VVESLAQRRKEPALPLETGPGASTNYVTSHVI
jgi:hypothetical protein